MGRHCCQRGRSRVALVIVAGSALNVAGAVFVSARMLPHCLTWRLAVLAGCSETSRAAMFVCSLERASSLPLRISTLSGNPPAKRSDRGAWAVASGHSCAVQRKQGKRTSVHLQLARALSCVSCPCSEAQLGRCACMTSSWQKVWFLWFRFDF